MNHSALLVSLCSLSLAACAAHSAPAPAPVAPAVAATPTNTSIAGARALAAGEALDLVLPCAGKLYFGPFQFTGEGQRLAVLTAVRSPSGAQVCGGGAFVDGDDVFQAVAGTGCIEGAADYRAHLDYEYAPGAGNSPANPIYLSLWTGDGTAATCDPLALHLEVQDAPTATAAR